MASWPSDVLAGTGLISADVESFARFDIFGSLTLHCVHARERRTMPQPFGEVLDGLGLADSKHFDATIGKIAGIAANTQRVRLRACVRTERDALHASADEETRGRHRDQPAAAMPSITAASSAFVTGPMNSFAILPSGAMM